MRAPRFHQLLSGAAAAWPPRRVRSRSERPFFPQSSLAVELFVIKPKPLSLRSARLRNVSPI